MFLITMTPSLVLALALVFAPQEPDDGETPAPPDPHAPQRVETHVRFYSLTGDVDHAKLKAAVEGLGQGARLLHGPVTSEARPRDHFIAIEAPVERGDREVLRAAKKGSRKVEELYVAAFGRPNGEADMEDEYAGRVYGLPRDMVLWMSSEMRWFETRDDALLFFYVKGFSAEECADSFDKLFEERPHEPYENHILRFSTTWTLAGEAKRSVVSKLEKALRKLPGVASASLDAETLRLHLTFRFADLRVCGPPLRPPPGMLPTFGEGDDGEGGAGIPGAAPRGERAIAFLPRVDVNALLDVIEKCGLRVGS